MLPPLRVYLYNLLLLFLVLLIYLSKGQINKKLDMVGAQWLCGFHLRSVFWRTVVETKNQIQIFLLIFPLLSWFQITAAQSAWECKMSKKKVTHQKDISYPMWSHRSWPSYLNQYIEDRSMVLKCYQMYIMRYFNCKIVYKTMCIK